MKNSKSMLSSLVSLQAMPPAQAHFCLKIEKICRNNLDIKADQRLLLAVSGGADSVALLIAMHALAGRLDVKINCMHINHGLRPNAANDESFVKRLCNELDIPCNTQKADVAGLAQTHSCGYEEAGRKARYDLLQKHAATIGAHHILTGHHCGDLAEDILMRLMRGAAWPALGGMSWRNGIVGRPFLHENPSDLKRLVSAFNIKWREDESNQSLAFRRNRMRHIILPMFRCENPSFDSTAAKLHRQAELDAQYWDEEIKNTLLRHPWQELTTDTQIELRLNKNLLQPLHPALRIRILNSALLRLRALGDCPGQNTSDSLEAIERLYNNRIGNKAVQCPGGITAKYANGGIRLLMPRHPG